MNRFIKTTLIALPLALGVTASFVGAAALAMDTRGGGDQRGGGDSRGSGGNNGRGNDGGDGGLICARVECMAPAPMPQRNDTCDAMRVFVPTGYGTGYFERRCHSDLSGRM